MAWHNGSIPKVVTDGETGVVVDSMDELVRRSTVWASWTPRPFGPRVQQLFSAEAMVAGYERAYAWTLVGEWAATSG